MNLRKNLLVALCALSGGLAAAAASADVLYLNSGDRLTGEIDHIGGGKIVLKTEFADTIAVKLETVKHLESDKVFEMRMTDGGKQRGQFAVTADAQQFRPRRLQRRFRAPKDLTVEQTRLESCRCREEYYAACRF